VSREISGCRRGSYAKGVSRRQAIVEATLGAFAQNGLDGVTFAAIGEMVGVSREGIRHYFANREDLLLAVIATADGESLAHAAGVDESDLFSKVIATAEHNAAVPGLVALYSTLVALSIATNHEQLRAVFEIRFASLRRDIESAVITGQEMGEIRRDVSPHVLASLIVAASDGLAMQWNLDSRIDLTEGLRLLQRLMRPGN
jgi:AcrR family transcriptional regulator